MSNDLKNQTPQARARCEFMKRHGDNGEVRVIRAPGRVNLIGEHTDYNDGFVLPMTLGRTVAVAIELTHDKNVDIHSLQFDETLRAPLEALPFEQTVSWKNYVIGVIEELRLLDLVPCGFNAVIAGDVPLGAGLSSSAALEVAVAMGLKESLGFEMKPRDIALLCQRVEHRYVGVQCGIMDQLASAMGKRGHVLFIDCRSLDCESIPFQLGDVSIVILDSHAPRELASSAYNERRSQCEEAVQRFQQYEPSVRSLRDVSLDAFNKHKATLKNVLRKRVRHVVTENDRVLRSVQFLRAGDASGLGEVFNRSHDSMRRDYEISSPPLDFLVETAQSFRGVLGARLTGAGFGGCTINLVQNDSIGTFREHLSQEYKRSFGKFPDVYVLTDNVEAGPIDL